MRPLRTLVCLVVGHRIPPTGRRDRLSEWGRFLGWEVTCSRCGRVFDLPLQSVPTTVRDAILNGVDDILEGVFGRRP